MRSQHAKNDNSQTSEESKQEFQTNATAVVEMSSTVDTWLSSNNHSYKFKQALPLLEDMDMRYAELTHRQLTISLDQIQRQSDEHVPDKQFKSSHMQNIAAASTGRDITASQKILSDLVGSNPCTEQKSPPISDSNVFERNSNWKLTNQLKSPLLLQVKDEILQEKEAAILKLRLHVSSLEHQIQESEATLRQVKILIFCENFRVLIVILIFDVRAVCILYLFTC